LQAFKLHANYNACLIRLRTPTKRATNALDKLLTIAILVFEPIPLEKSPLRQDINAYALRRAKVDGNVPQWWRWLIRNASGSARDEPQTDTQNARLLEASPRADRLVTKRGERIHLCGRQRKKKVIWLTTMKKPSL